MKAVSLLVLSIFSLASLGYAMGNKPPAPEKPQKYKVEILKISLVNAPTPEVNKTPKTTVKSPKK